MTADFPRLSDPQDVADRLLECLDLEFAETTASGSRQAFAEAIKKRLADWNPAAAGNAGEEYREFRSEVRMKLATGLDIWAGRNAASAAS